MRNNNSASGNPGKHGVLAKCFFNVDRKMKCIAKMKELTYMRLDRVLGFKDLVSYGTTGIRPIYTFSFLLMLFPQKPSCKVHV